MSKPKKITLWLVGVFLTILVITGVYTAAEPLTFNQQDLAAINRPDGQDDQWKTEMKRVVTETVTGDFQLSGGSSYGSNLTAGSLNQILESFLEDYKVGRQPEVTQYIEMIDQLEREQSAPLKEHQLEDLNITQRSDKAALRRYAHKMGEIILEGSRDTEHEVIIVNRLLAYRDPSDAELLRQNAAGYKQIIEEALALEVPKLVAEKHLAVLNQFEKIKLAQGYMSTLLDDPFRGVIGMRRYRQNRSPTAEALTEMARTLSQRGVEFEPGEPGFAYTFWAH